MNEQIIHPTARRSLSRRYLAIAATLLLAPLSALSATSGAFADDALSAESDAGSVQQFVDAAMLARPGGTTLVTLNAGSSTGNAPLGVKSLTCS